MKILLSVCLYIQKNCLIEIIFGNPQHCFGWGIFNYSILSGGLCNKLIIIYYESKGLPFSFWLIYLVHVDKIGMESSILYFKGLLVRDFMEWCVSVPESFFFLANSADLDEMPHKSGSSLSVKVPVYRYPKRKKGYTLNIIQRKIKYAIFAF